jgi:hypothetical protein
MVGILITIVSVLIGSALLVLGFMSISGWEKNKTKGDLIRIVGKGRQVWVNSDRYSEDDLQQAVAAAKNGQGELVIVDNGTKDEDAWVRLGRTGATIMMYNHLTYLKQYDLQRIAKACCEGGGHLLREGVGEVTRLYENSQNKLEWTEKDDLLIEELFNSGATCPEVAQELERSEEEINSRLKCLGLLD